MFVGDRREAQGAAYFAFLLPSSPHRFVASTGHPDLAAGASVCNFEIDWEVPFTNRRSIPAREESHQLGDGPDFRRDKVAIHTRCAEDPGVHPNEQHGSECPNFGLMNDSKTAIYFGSTHRIGLALVDFAGIMDFSLESAQYTEAAKPCLTRSEISDFDGRTVGIEVRDQDVVRF